mmetsp:Transcript_86132/g.206382  ORF Transcript_86132/g.206382 Transcript_86132/m.206382 type:complete len:211 (-) Transcript_86132:1420-2052(-)
MVSCMAAWCLARTCSASAASASAATWVQVRPQRSTASRPFGPNSQSWTTTSRQGPLPAFDAWCAAVQPFTSAAILSSSLKFPSVRMATTASGTPVAAARCRQLQPWASRFTRSEAVRMPFCRNFSTAAKAPCCTSTPAGRAPRRAWFISSSFATPLMVAMGPQALPRNSEAFLRPNFSASTSGVGASSQRSSSTASCSLMPFSYSNRILW